VPKAFFIADVLAISCTYAGAFKFKLNAREEVAWKIICKCALFYDNSNYFVTIKYNNSSDSNAACGDEPQARYVSANLMT
jgi:hypothetical protein